jgi:glycosyltransferase involved in cell wall biosynthesis
LIVAGNDPESEEAHYLRERASILEVELTIKYVRSSEEMAHLYAQAQILVFAPLYEWLGLVALESMACGTLVIGVNQGGLLETVKDGVTGVLVERTPKALAGALQELLRDPERIEAMGRAGRAYIEAYWTWQRAVDDLEAQFAAVLGER